MDFLDWSLLSDQNLDSITPYEKAIQYDPKMADAYLNLGVIYRYEKHDDTKALDYWQKYLALKPDDPEAKQIQQEIIRIVKEHMPAPTQGAK